MPILALMMFLIGTELSKASFKDIIKNPIPILIGLIGQLFFLPLIAIFIGLILDLNPIYFAGLMLIALSPGGSSSNVFTLLAKGNVELSVLLTLLSSLITLVSLPIIMKWVAFYLLSDASIELDGIGQKIVLQNIVLTVVPMSIGVFLKAIFPKVIRNVSKILHKVVLPALLTLVLVFILQHGQEIYDNIFYLGGAVTGLIMLALLCSSILSRICKLSTSIKKRLLLKSVCRTPRRQSP